MHANKSSPRISSPRIKVINYCGTHDADWEYARAALGAVSRRAEQAKSFVHSRSPASEVITIINVCNTCLAAMDKIAF